MRFGVPKWGRHEWWCALRMLLVILLTNSFLVAPIAQANQRNAQQKAGTVLAERLGCIRQVQEEPIGAELLVQVQLRDAELSGMCASVDRVDGRLCLLVEKIDLAAMNQAKLTGLIAAVSAREEAMGVQLDAICVTVKEIQCLAAQLDHKLEELNCLMCQLNKQLACLAQAICCLEDKIRGAIIWAFVVGVIIGAIGGSFITCGGSVPPAVASVPIW